MVSTGSAEHLRRLTGMSAGCPNSMLHDSFPWRRWVLLIAPHLYYCVKAQIPMSDWRTGIATNYGGVQDGRVSTPPCSLWCQ